MPTNKTDHAGERRADRSSVDVMHADTEAALTTLATAARDEHARRAEHRKVMTALFRSAAFKRALSANEALAPVVERATEALAADESAAKEEIATIADLRERLAADFAKLAALRR